MTFAELHKKGERLGPKRLGELRQRIETREAVLGVVGLGYVGLSVASMLADAGFRVTGVEIKPERVALINAGRSPIGGKEPGLADLLKQVAVTGHLRATTNYAQLREADVVLIDVETPVDDEYHKPRFEALRAACLSLGAVLKEGALVIVESTIAPGTIDRLVKPLLEETTGWREGVGFFLGHCPERVMPGKLIAHLRTLSRVCGGSTPETAETMATLYRTIVAADVDLADCVTAELVKTAENAYRDVNIAFANELALVCEATGGDFLRVRELVNKSPGRNVLMAGAGVGGHCIPKDSWLLSYGAEDKMPLRLVPTARAVNDDMPGHMARLLKTGLNRHGKLPTETRITIMGYTYLENSDDARNSPSAALEAILQGWGVQVIIHDPFLARYDGDWQRAVKDADGIAFMVAHDVYRSLALPSLREMVRTPVLVDGRNIFDGAAARAAGFTYLGVGRGSLAE